MGVEVAVFRASRVRHPPRLLSGSFDSHLAANHGPQTPRGTTCFKIAAELFSYLNEKRMLPSWGICGWTAVCPTADGGPSG
jgi:hypothetical protein